MRNKAVIYGLISGGIASVFFLGPFLFIDVATSDFEGLEVLGYLTMLLSMMLVVVGILSYRKLEMNGSITFLPAFKMGMLITIISTVLFYGANILLYEVLSPNLLTDFMDVYPEQMLEANPNDPEVAQMVKEYEEMRDVYTNGWIYGLLMSGTTFFMGLTLALLTSGVLAVVDRYNE